jgi:hypothetical protein
LLTTLVRMAADLLKMNGYLANVSLTAVHLFD